ncbi:hypothetical protein [Ramlibacter sp.]|uniref:hypothetical protein n=1 Tax=Ramlibacter sp. TaxID=1917967 RepID=UPI003D137286
MPDRALFDTWKIADEEARRAEAELKERLAAFEEGREPQPRISRVLEVKLKRARATELLDKYIRTAGTNSGPGEGGWRHSA